MHNIKIMSILLNTHLFGATLKKGTLAAVTLIEVFSISNIHFREELCNSPFCPL